MRLRPRSVWILITLALVAGPSAAAPASAPAPSPGHARLDAALSALESKGVSVGLSAHTLEGKPLLTHGAGTPLVPASTMKLLTSACALERLGPAWSTSTRFLASTHPGPDGALHGALHVDAGGDPLLRGEDLWVAVEALRARSGLTRVEGDVVIDASLFSGSPRPAPWPSKGVNDPYDAPQGAFAVGYSSTELVVRPGAKAGAPALIDLFPVRDLVPIRNSVKTGSRTRIKVTLIPDPSGPGTLSVSGTIASSRRSYREWVRLADADRAGLSALRELLTRAGIEVGGRVRLGALPEQELVPLYAHQSPSLAELVRVVNKFSSNFGAEILLRHLSETGDEGKRSTESGLVTLERCAAAWGVPEAERVLRDGSGYARTNRLSAAALVKVLLHGAQQRSWFPEWLSSLPRSGEDGSLRKRLRDLGGRVRAKTGSLSGVAALAGFATDDEGQEIVFAIILNGPRAAVSASEVDRLTRLVIAAAPETRAAATSKSDAP